jgi:hypothetical protein
MKARFQKAANETLAALAEFQLNNRCFPPDRSFQRTNRKDRGYSKNQNVWESIWTNTGSKPQILPRKRRRRGENGLEATENAATAHSLESTDTSYMSWHWAEIRMRLQSHSITQQVRLALAKPSPNQKIKPFFTASPCLKIPGIRLGEAKLGEARLLN